MNNKLFSELLIVESLKTAREYAQKAEISERAFKKAEEIDATPTKKLMHQILKWYKVIYDEMLQKYSYHTEERKKIYAADQAGITLDSWGNKKNKVNKYLDSFVSLSGSVIKEPIEKFKTVDEFKEFMQPFYQKQREKIESKSKELVFENDKILIFRPLTKGAVCVYGFDTQWCITQEENDYYERYRLQTGYTFYFAFSKIFKKKSNPFAKMAICIGRDGQVAEVRDNLDAAIGTDHMKSWLLDNDVPKDVVETKLVSVPLALSEKWNDEKLRSMGMLDNGDGTYKIENQGRTFNISDEFIGDDGKLIFKITGCNGSISIGTSKLTTFENFPEKINGNLIITNSKFTTLEGCPDVTGVCEIRYNSILTSLKGCPQNPSSFVCVGNRNLETLEYAPKNITHTFDCSENNLYTLIGSPSTLETFVCASNPRITSLSGGPQTVRGEYNAVSTGITSLVGISEVGTLNVKLCQIKTFNNPTAKIDVLHVSRNPIENFDGMPIIGKELNLGYLSNPELVYPITNWSAFKHIPRIVINSAHKYLFATVQFPRGFKTKFKFLNWTG